MAAFLLLINTRLQSGLTFKLKFLHKKYFYYKKQYVNYKHKKLARPMLILIQALASNCFKV